MLKAWRQETLDALKKTRDSLDKVDKKLTEARKEKREVREAALELEQAEKAYDFILKAKGVHNVGLAGAILEQAQKDAQKAQERLAFPQKNGND
jgi:hypothetical protein